MRIENLQKEMRDKGLTSFLVKNPSNLFYLEEIPKTWEGELLVTEGESYYLTDSRFFSEAKSLLGESEVILKSQDAEEALFRLLPPGSLGFDDWLSAGEYLKIQAKASNNDLLEDKTILHLRRQKDAHEIDRLRAAAGLLEKVFSWITTQPLIGLREKDLSWQIEKYLRQELGAEDLAFATILASGANSALPHARPSEKRIAEDELLKIDCGAVLSGYCSDATRTFSTGKLDRKSREIYNVVLQAQAAALETVGPGVAPESVDRAAREVIEEAGWGKYFIHGTGHGIGIDVHEEPGLRAGFTEPLRAGDVVTIEPGIYIPGHGGVRIEDTVIIHEKYVENISPMSKDLLEVG